MVAARVGDSCLSPQLPSDPRYRCSRSQRQRGLSLSLGTGQLASGGSSAAGSEGDSGGLGACAAPAAEGPRMVTKLPSICVSSPVTWEQQ